MKTKACIYPPCREATLDALCHRHAIIADLDAQGLLFQDAKGLWILDGRGKPLEGPYADAEELLENWEGRL